MSASDEVNQRVVFLPMPLPNHEDRITHLLEQAAAADADKIRCANAGAKSFPSVGPSPPRITAQNVRQGNLRRGPFVNRPRRSGNNA